MNEFSNWKKNLENFKVYVTAHKECPSIERKQLLKKYGVEYAFQNLMYIDVEAEKLGIWVQLQKIHYKKDLIKNLKIKQLWEDTINDPEYSEYLSLNKFEKWKLALEKVEEYIQINKKMPNPQCNFNFETKKLGIWLKRQVVDYDNNIMKPKIRNLWENFTEKYNLAF